MIEGTQEAPAPSGTLRAWVQALDALEHDLLVAERLLATVAAEVPTPDVVVGPWTRPEPMGALPASLLARAEELVRRQLAVRDGLAGALEVSRAGLARLGRGEGSPGPAYVDISA